MDMQTVLNGISTAVRSIVPNDLHFENPIQLQGSLHIINGVEIGVIGDLRGNLIISSNYNTYRNIAKSMYGMELEGELLLSFSTELSNMIAGSFSTILDMNNIHIDITPPTMINGDVLLTGYENAFQLTFLLEIEQPLDVYILME